jgi:carboxypeptidase Taq
MPLLSTLRDALVPLLRCLSAQEKPNDSFLRQRYPLTQQFAFARTQVAEFGYDFSRGRLDETHHPFAIEFSLDDVRITTRGREDYLPEALFCTFHESGHGMYHQGLEPRLEGTPLADGSSAGVHESQSRLWENIVGRSRGFWHYAFPKLQRAFPEQLAGVPLEDFYRAINTVTPSRIRTQADEVSYNLHVIIRFELELELLEGKLSVTELPDAWRARYADLLGVTVPNDRDGVLQDVHWFSGPIGGAFQGYTLGNILSAQFYEAACQTHPEIPQRLEAGDFSPLYQWTRDTIHRHGRTYDPGDMIKRICGTGLDTGPYLRYLGGKYGELYEL